MARRLKTYRTANNSEVAEPSVQDFFGRNGVKVFNESTTTPIQIALAAFKIYIERVSIREILTILERETLQLHDL